MKKYWIVFQQSFQNEFVYRLNFILWRVRNVLRMLMTYFLWNSIFLQNKLAFGYSREQMMAYVFLVLIISTFVTAAPSNENIGGEIGSGDLSNFLVKPINYLYYWLTRDWASKLLNMLFAVLEITILWFIFRPQISISHDPRILFLGIIASLMATLSYFLVSKLAVFVAFWNPENTWGMLFIIIVFFEVLSGGIFPLNILPNWVYNLIQITPFPYWVYFPISILVGKFDLRQSLVIILQSLIWLVLSFYFVKKLWQAGLKVYSASGR